MTVCKRQLSRSSAYLIRRYDMLDAVCEIMPEDHPIQQSKKPLAFRKHHIELHYDNGDTGYFKNNAYKASAWMCPFHQIHKVRKKFGGSLISFTQKLIDLNVKFYVVSIGFSLPIGHPIDNWHGALKTGIDSFNKGRHKAKIDAFRLMWAHRYEWSYHPKTDRWNPHIHGIWLVRTMGKSPREMETHIDEVVGKSYRDKFDGIDNSSLFNVKIDDNDPIGDVKKTTNYVSKTECSQKHNEEEDDDSNKNQDCGISPFQVAKRFTDTGNERYRERFLEYAAATLNGNRSFAIVRTMNKPQQKKILKQLGEVVETSYLYDDDYPPVSKYFPDENNNHAENDENMIVITESTPEEDEYSDEVSLIPVLAPDPDDYSQQYRRKHVFKLSMIVWDAICANKLRGKILHDIIQYDGDLNQTINNALDNGLFGDYTDLIDQLDSYIIQNP